MLQGRENLMEAIQAFLKEYDHIPPKEKCMALLLAEERFLKIKQVVEEKQNQPEVMQDLLLKLINDLEILNGIQPKQEEHAAKVSSQYWNCPVFYDDDEEYSIQYKEYLEKSSKAITADLPTVEPDNSLSIGDEHLSTILETESDEVIKYSVENLVLIPSEFKGISDDTCDNSLDVFNEHFETFSDLNNDCTSSNDDSFEDIDYESDEFIKSSGEDLIPIPSESEDTSENDSESVLPSSDDFSPIFEEKSVTFSNPLFNSNDNFTSSDDESLSDEDVPEDNTYSKPLFEFEDEYISSDINPLFDEELEDIKCNVSYDSNLDESTFLVTPLSDSNKDECFTPSDDVELLLYRDSSTPMISVVSILKGFTDEPPLKENDDLFDLESNKNEWKNILYDDPIDDLIFDPGDDIDEIDTILDVDIPTNIEDGYHDSDGDIHYLESLLSDDTTLSLHLKLFLDHDPRSLRDSNDLKIMVKVFNPGIHEKFFSPTYVSLNFEDRHYLSFTYVI
ncbi:hypothetical protein Tco_0591759 [Tanacetum coccineum]